MTLYIQQKMLSAWDTFFVKDETGADVYQIVQPRKTVTVGLQLQILDMEGNELAFIKQKALALNGTFFVTVGGVQTATIKKKFTMFKPKYVVEELGWTITGDFLAHEYTIENESGVPIMSIHKDWTLWQDSFAIELFDTSRVLEALAVVVVIDHIVDHEGNGYRVNGKKLS